ncbi:hypothetical protein B1O40_16295 [Listeria monocytogenes]|nr:hypothetical protein [Listeria monocytogenes]EAG3044300.1 hypothetical protein [Listeria monocytogenes]
MGAYSDREVSIEKIFKTKAQAVEYIASKGFTTEKYGGYVRPFAKQRGYSEADLYYVEEWEVNYPTKLSTIDRGDKNGIKD